MAAAHVVLTGKRATIDPTTYVAMSHFLRGLCDDDVFAYLAMDALRTVFLLPREADDMHQALSARPAKSQELATRIVGSMRSDFPLFLKDARKKLQELQESWDVQAMLQALPSETLPFPPSLVEGRLLLQPQTALNPKTLSPEKR